MSILKKLGSGDMCVIDFDVCSDNRIVTLTECCDMYYCANLDKKEFGQFIDELKAMHEKMIDV